MASIHSQDEMDGAEAVLGGQTVAWIGLSHDESGVWFWLTARPLTTDL